MPVIRSTDKFVLVERALLEDPMVSWAAKGLYAYLSTMPEGMDDVETFLEPYLSERPDETHKLLEELINAEYLSVGDANHGSQS